MICRVLPFETCDGPGNMALDEALLDAVADDPSHAIARTYGWTEPTLSLGYFQAILEAEADPRWNNVAIVRRPTGGGALWHEHEVTYAVVIPAAHPLARPSEKLYQAIHAAVVERLRRRGFDTALRGDITAGVDFPNLRPFLCFTDRDRADIVDKGVMKVMGSAQRRRRGAVLQHGSLLIHASETTPELGGLLGPRAGAFSTIEWSRLLESAITDALGLDGNAGRLDARALERAAELREQVYTREAWTRRR
jgi:lipoate-protein ligase A